MDAFLPGRMVIGTLCNVIYQYTYFLAPTVVALRRSLRVAETPGGQGDGRQSDNRSMLRFFGINLISELGPEGYCQI